VKKDLIIEVIYPDIFDLDHMLESKAFPFIREGKNLPNWFQKTKPFSTTGMFNKHKSVTNATIKTCWGIRRYFTNTIVFPVIEDMHYIYNDQMNFILEETLLVQRKVIWAETHPLHQFETLVPILEKRDLSIPIKLGFPYYLRIKNHNLQISGTFNESFWDDTNDEKIKIIPGIFDIVQDKYLQMNVFFCIKKEYWNEHQRIQTGVPFCDLTFNLPTDYNLKLEYLPKGINELAEINFGEVIRAQQFSSPMTYFFNIFKNKQGIFK
jgi:hypothetical protein